MKTLDDLYNSVMKSDELKREFVSLNTNEALVKWVKDQGVEATSEEVIAFLKEKNSRNGELSEEELDQVAGGKSADWMEAYFSVFTAGIACGVTAIVSKCTGTVGTAIEGKGMLCKNRPEEDKDPNSTLSEWGDRFLNYVKDVID